MQESRYIGWGIFFQQAPFGDTTYLGWIWQGVQVTLALSICSWLVALIFGSLFGIFRTLPGRFFTTLGALYVALFRNIPLLVQFFFWVFVLPGFLSEPVANWFYNETPFAFLAATLCLGLFTGARLCEQVRAAIQSLPSGQKSAGLALGLTLLQSYRYVLLPNAFRRVIPPMTSELMGMIKNTAAASMVGLLDLTARGNSMLEYSGHPYQAFIAVTLAYVLVSLIALLLMRVIEKKSRLPGTLGAKS